MSLLQQILGGGDASGIAQMLSPEQQAAINRQSMMALGAKLLQGSRTPQRMNLAQGVGQALEAGMQAQQAGQMSAVQQMLLGQKLREGKAQQDRAERFSQLLGGGAPAPAQTPAALTPEQALLAPDAGPVGPTQQRADMMQPPAATQPQPSPQAVSSMMPSALQLLSPEQRALLGSMPVEKAQEQLFNVTQEAMKFGEPKPENRGGQTVMVARNGFGQERILEGVQPFESTPTSIREYQFALSQGFRGSLQDFITAKAKAGAARQTVNVGDTQFGPTSTDRMRIPDPTAPGGFRIIDIPGGQADVEAQQRAQADAFKQANLERAGGTVVQDIGRALSILGEAGPLATGRGALVGRLDPVSQASQIEDLVGSVRGNIGVDQLQQMRNASPTGGALGNVTERQLEGLQGLLGSLKVTGDRQILEDNLKRISNIYMDTIHGTPEQIRRLGPQRGLTPEQIEMLAERQELSFDERGRRTGAAGRPRQQSLGEIFGR